MQGTSRSVMLTKNQNKFADMLFKSATKTLAYKKTYATAKMSSKTINQAASSSGSTINGIRLLTAFNLLLSVRELIF